MKNLRILTLLSVSIILTGCAASEGTGSIAGSNTSNISVATAVSSSITDVATNEEVVEVTAEKVLNQEDINALLSENSNIAHIYVTDVYTEGENKQFDYVTEISDKVKVMLTFVFDSNDKVLGAIYGLESLNGYTFDESLVQDEQMGELNYTPTKITSEILDIEKVGYTADVPMFSNGIEYAHDGMNDMAKLANAMLESGTDGNYSYSGSLNFDDAEIVEVSEEAWENSPWSTFGEDEKEEKPIDEEEESSSSISNE